MILLVAASVPLGWLAKTLERVRRQREAVAKIVASRGEVTYAHEYITGGYHAPRGNWLLRRLVGDDAFASVVYVRWTKTSPTDEQLGALVQLPEVTWVTLNGKNVTDAGARTLARLNSLTSLCLVEARFSTRGLDELAACPALKALSFRDARELTDEDLQGLGRISKLRYLTIHRAGQVAGVGLKYVAKPEQMEVLDLAGSAIIDDAMVHVAEMAELKTLSLTGTKVTNAGVRKIGTLPKLRELNLRYMDFAEDGILALIAGAPLERLEIDGNPITDKAMREIGKLKSLRLLTLEDTNVTDAGVLELQACTSLRDVTLGSEISLDAAKKLKAALPPCNVCLTSDEGWTRTVE